ILSELYVREGDIVEKDQILAQLDLTKTEATVEESAARYRALLANIARLESEVNNTALIFPEELTIYPELIEAETRLHETRQQALEESVSGLQDALDLVEEELALTQMLAKQGAASNVDVLKLQRQVSDLKLRITDKRSEYMVGSREELGKAQAEAASLESVVRGRVDSL